MSDELDMGRLRAEHGMTLTVRELLKSEVPDLSRELEVLSRSDMSALVQQLCEMTSDDSAGRRRDAVVALGVASYCSPVFAEEAEPAIIKRLADDVEEIRLEAVRALGRRGDATSRMAIKSLISQVLKNPIVGDKAISATLKVLRRCDPQAASQAESCLTAILAKGEIATELQVDICETLGGFGSGALMAVETLLKILPTEAAKSKNLRKGPERIRKSKKVPISTTADPTLVRAAVVAIAKIDPNGSQVMKSVRTIDELEQLRIGLHSFGDTSVRPLLEQLTQHVAELKVRPPAGRERRQMKELVEIIFGPGPSVEPENEKSKQEAERWNNSREGNIADWLAAKKLRGMRVAHGSYDVETGDLERLKQIYRGREPSDNH